MLDASSERIFFFYLSPLAGFSFLDKFLLQDFFFGGGGGGRDFHPTSGYF